MAETKAEAAMTPPTPTALLSHIAWHLAQPEITPAVARTLLEAARDALAVKASVTEMVPTPTAAHMSEMADRIDRSDPNLNFASVSKALREAAAFILAAETREQELTRRDGLLNKAGREQFDRAEAAEAQATALAAERDAANVAAATWRDRLAAKMAERDALRMALTCNKFGGGHYCPNCDRSIGPELLDAALSAPAPDAQAAPESEAINHAHPPLSSLQRTASSGEHPEPRPGDDPRRQGRRGSLLEDAGRTIREEVAPTSDARAIVQVLGFDPTNHHNALACPYCNPTAKLFSNRLTFTEPTAELATETSDGLGRPLSESARDELLRLMGEADASPRPDAQEAPASWKCRASKTTDPPQDCDWPSCGCDPAAMKVIEALEEMGAFEKIGGCLRPSRPDAQAEPPPRLLSPAPCDQCGYNGEGYFQPSTHPCAAAHHRAQAETPAVKERP